MIPMDVGTLVDNRSVRRGRKNKHRVEGASSSVCREAFFEMCNDMV